MTIKRTVHCNIGVPEKDVKLLCGHEWFSCGHDKYDYEHTWDYKERFSNSQAKLYGDSQCLECSIRLKAETRFKVGETFILGPPQYVGGITARKDLTPFKVDLKQASKAVWAESVAAPGGPTPAVVTKSVSEFLQGVLSGLPAGAFDPKVNVTQDPADPTMYHMSFDVLLPQVLFLNAAQNEFPRPEPKHEILVDGCLPYEMVNIPVVTVDLPNANAQSCGYKGCKKGPIGGYCEEHAILLFTQESGPSAVGKAVGKTLEDYLAMKVVVMVDDNTEPP